LPSPQPKLIGSAAPELLHRARWPAPRSVPRTAPPVAPGLTPLASPPWPHPPGLTPLAPPHGPTPLSPKCAAAERPDGSQVNPDHGGPHGRPTGAGRAGVGPPRLPSQNAQGSANPSRDTRAERAEARWQLQQRSRAAIPQFTPNLPASAPALAEPRHCGLANSCNATRCGARAAVEKPKRPRQGGKH
jgi:hypothetical protein